jgi:hypothetical protein
MSSSFIDGTHVKKPNEDLDKATSNVGELLVPIDGEISHHVSNFKFIAKLN